MHEIKVFAGITVKRATLRHDFVRRDLGINLKEKTGHEFTNFHECRINPSDRLKRSDGLVGERVRAKGRWAQSHSKEFDSKLKGRQPTGSSLRENLQKFVETSR